MAGIASRVAVITGAASGIGKATLNILLDEGMHIAAVDRIGGSLLEMNMPKDRCLAVECDVSKAGEVKKLVEEISQWRPDSSVSALINAAGITRDNWLLKMTEAEFDEVINVNLKGTFLMSQAFADVMQKGGAGGSIVNLSSISGKVGNLGQSNYAASKAGVVGVTKTAAKELARHGIRCNAVMPGFIETPMTKGVPDQVLAKIVPQIPMKRMGLAEEVAHCIAFLASERSSYITGTCIEVTGGLYM
ncbi:estradiol 17-beta-dehydrogenase 8-like [Sycon ciliatum]|uniref:estradiol 17-beta-dehydrogenase 8-like n=1 Tax=Sycon ciliatum TaxID=27933 RepID=UPI0031F7113E|eukprot:scpid62267/ scgid20697/ Estradiol 17-beta-dehydrogenase 8; 17-beta-hydroxysteroid dehydrogenase 8; 3-oxoacyl-[acyl-carrier-protein] reductase; Testosterone 17-beta-dehydrogenase 8